MATGAPASTRARRPARGVRGIWILLPALHRLGEEVEQPGVGVVGLLQQLIRRTTVVGPELVLRVERRRVQGLAAAEVGDRALDRAVVERLVLAGRQVDAAPESDVDVRRVRIERVEVPVGARVALT